MILTLVGKTLRDRWRSSVSWAVALSSLAAVQLYIYPSIKKSGDAMNQFLKAFPKELISMFRIEDYTSGAGFLGTELFSMMVPLVFISVGASWGAAIADEEERGTSEVLYVLPIRRISVVTTKVVSAWIVLLAIGVTVDLVIWIGSGMVGLNLNQAKLIPVTLSCVALGVFFNGLATVVSCAFGRRTAALGLSIGVGLLSFLIFSLAPMVTSFDAILPAMPFEWALGTNPLLNGFDWKGMFELFGAALLCYLAALTVINRRDIRA